MNRIIVFFLAIILWHACNKDEEAFPNRDVKVYGDENFMRYNSDWNCEDMVLNLDGSITLVGNARNQTSNFLVQPFILNLDNQKNVGWTNFLNLDEKNFYRDVEIIPTKDEQYMILTYSDPLGNGDFNIDLFKVHSDGYLSWQKNIEQNEFETNTSSIIQLENGDYAILSKLSKSTGLFTDQFLLLRVSESGDIVWSEIIEDIQITGTKQLFFLPADNSIIALTEHLNAENFINYDLKIHKFSEDGNKIWTKSIVTDQDMFIESSLLTVIEGEEIFLSYSANDDAEYSPDITLINLDTDGNIIWKEVIEGGGTDIPEEIIRSEDGNLIILLSSTSFSNQGFNIMLTKFDPISRSIIWDRVYGSQSSDWARKIVQRQNGNIIIMGNSNHGNTNEAIYDFFILETDREGNPI